MVTERVQGLAEQLALFDALPDAAKDELGLLIGGFALDVLGDQRQFVPERTGALARGLSAQSQLEQLRAKIGLLGLVKGQGKLWYGRVVQFGRRAQVVLVSRRRVGASKRLRGGRKRAEDIAATYSLRVSPLTARNFIYVDTGEQDAQLVNRLADFWSKSLTRAGASE